MLVTGANGQLGREMRRLGAASPNEYTFTDVAELDITDAAAVMASVKAGGYDVILNCAAYTNVDRAEDDEAAAEKINCDAVRNLAEAAKQTGAVLFHISTDYVFGGEGNTPRREDMPLSPLGAYGRTKLHGEQAVEATGCRAVIVRTAWLYSEYGNNFVKTMIRLGRERKELGVVFDQIGTPTYARDLAKAIIAILDKGIVPGVYHYSNEGVTSWYDFAKKQSAPPCAHGRGSSQLAIILIIVPPPVNTEKVVFYGKKVPTLCRFFLFSRENSSNSMRLFVISQSSAPCNPRRSRVK